MKKTIFLILIFMTVSLFGEENGVVTITDIQKWNHPTKKVFVDNGFEVEKVELKDNKRFPIFYLNGLNSEKIYSDKFLKEVAKANSYWSFKLIEDSKFAEVWIDKNKKIYALKTDKESLKYFYDTNVELKAKQVNTLKLKVISKKDPEDKIKMYKELVNFFNTIPARDVNSQGLKQDKKYYKYKSKTANFYEYIFHTPDNDISEISTETKKDFNRNKKITEKIKKFTDEFIQLVFEINTESEVIFEDEKTVILRDYVNITRTGLMKPIDYTGLSFITEIDKNSNIITAVNIEVGTEPLKGTYFTWEYEEMVEEYSRNNRILHRENDFDYEKVLSAFIIKLEKTKEKIVGILFFGGITKSENGKYHFYSIDMEDGGEKIEFKKTMSNYDRILYYKILDKKSPSQSNYDMIFHKTGKGVEFMEQPDGNIKLAIKEGELRDGINLNGDLIILPVSEEKYGIYDYLGNNILNGFYESIEKINFNDNTIFKVRNGKETEYFYISENSNNYWQIESYDIYKLEDSREAEKLNKYIEKKEDEGLSLLK